MQAGGRCRSYLDPVLGRVIDNGNHLVLSGNHATMAYLDRIGSRARLAGPPEASFPFVDVADGRRWTIRPSPGPVPWWLFDASRRVPGHRTRRLSAARRAPHERPRPPYRSVDVLHRASVGPAVAAVLPCRTEHATEGGFGRACRAVVRESLAKGGRACARASPSPNCRPPSSIRRWNFSRRAAGATVWPSRARALSSATMR